MSPVLRLWYPCIPMYLVPGIQSIIPEKLPNEYKSHLPKNTRALNLKQTTGWMIVIIMMLAKLLDSRDWDRFDGHNCIGSAQYRVPSTEWLANWINANCSTVSSLPLFYNTFSLSPMHLVWVLSIVFVFFFLFFFATKSQRSLLATEQLLSVLQTHTLHIESTHAHPPHNTQLEYSVSSEIKLKTI